LGSLLLVVKHGLPVLELEASELETLSNELITRNALNCRQNRVELKRLFNDVLAIHQYFVYLVFKGFVLIEFSE
jgi:hypothetical protein